VDSRIAKWQELFEEHAERFSLQVGGIDEVPKELTDLTDQLVVMLAERNLPYRYVQLAVDFPFDRNYAAYASDQLRLLNVAIEKEPYLGLICTTTSLNRQGYTDAVYWGTKRSQRKLVKALIEAREEGIDKETYLEDTAIDVKSVDKLKQPTSDTIKPLEVTIESHETGRIRLISKV
jgi:hypothetical protein